MDFADPQVRADAIASGAIWSAPMAAQEAACDDIAAGKAPVPSYLPGHAKAMLSERGMNLEGASYSDEGAGPA